MSFSTRYAEKLEDAALSPGQLNLGKLAAYIRRSSGCRRPFIGPDRFTPEVFAEINRRIIKTRSYFLSKMGTIDTCVGVEIEFYYLNLLAKYQYCPLGFDTEAESAKKYGRYGNLTRPRSLMDWHTLLDFLSEKIFYWSKQHRVNVAQIESMVRIWFIIRRRFKIQREICSLQHAYYLRDSQLDTERRKPGSRSRIRRIVRRSGRDPAV